MLPEHEPDNEEKIIQFIFGFVAGAVISFSSLCRFEYRFEHLLVFSALAALVFGVLATHYGDRFWYALLRHIRWW